MENNHNLAPIVSLFVCLFLPFVCLFVATLPMAGWADPVDCGWWKTITTWPIHWEHSFAYPRIYKHLKTFINIFSKVNTGSVSHPQGAEKITTGVLSMLSVDLVGIPALVWRQVRKYMRLKSCSVTSDRRISAVTVPTYHPCHSATWWPYFRTWKWTILYIFCTIFLVYQRSTRTHFLLVHFHRYLREGLQ